MASAKKTKSAPSKGPVKKPKKAATSSKAGAKKTGQKAALKPANPRPVKLASKVAKPAPQSVGIGTGARAPSFKLKDHAGKELSSSALAGSPYVLYFYPKDDTTGCTKQACGFRDSFRSFGQKRARVIGVSPDSEASHARFVAKYGLPFTLLSDPDKVLANAYGVWAKKLNYGREYMGIVRSTFVVDGKGVVQNVWRGVKVDGHVDKVFEAIKAL